MKFKKFLKENEDRDYDVVDFIMDYEDGNMSQEDIIKGFQKLLDSGLVWKLQGAYGRMAQELIDKGLIHKK